LSLGIAYVEGAKRFDSQRLKVLQVTAPDGTQTNNGEFHDRPFVAVR
jgi:hypothetical protein